MFCNKPGLHKGDVRSDKIARCNDVLTIGVLGTDGVFATSVQICQVSASHVAPGSQRNELFDNYGKKCGILETMALTFV